jgi:hypothetical protein
MNKVGTVLKQLGRGVLLLFMGAILFLTTACNSGDKLGARPNNPPVQMGGNNNSYTRGGDDYGESRMTTDPSVKGVNKRASLPQSSDHLIAINNPVDQARNPIYPGSGNLEASRSVDDFVSPERQKELTDPAQIPAKRQPVFDRSDPKARLLEKTGQQFKDASEFLQERDAATRERPELKTNPGVE